MQFIKHFLNSSPKLFLEVQELSVVPWRYHVNVEYYLRFLPHILRWKGDGEGGI